MVPTVVPPKKARQGITGTAPGAPRTRGSAADPHRPETLYRQQDWPPSHPRDTLAATPRSEKPSIDRAPELRGVLVLCLMRHDHGVGSGYVPPKMSLLPNVAGHVPSTLGAAVGLL